MSYTSSVIDSFLKDRTPQQLALALARFEDLASRNIGNTGDTIKRLCAEYRNELKARWNQ